MVYGYIRVSTDKQTVENQRFEIERFCKKEGLTIDGWIEETISGTKNYNKRALGKLLNRIVKDDLIICTELSRLGRNLFMIMEILNICMTKESRVWTIKDNYRLGDDIQSKVLAFAFGLSAEIERNLISQRTKEALARLKKEGHPVQELVKPISFAPSVMCDLKTSSTWYTPGGNSTIARLYADAGANYIFREDTHSGSLPYPFEVIFEKGQQTDFWLIRYNQPIDKTYKELEKEFAPYAGFRAFKERNIYGCNTNRVPFYEETPFHPDWLLKDLIKIFHPSLLEGYELRYYKKLSE